MHTPCADIQQPKPCPMSRESMILAPHATHSCLPRLPDIVFSPLAKSSACGWTSEEVCPWWTVFLWFINFQFRWSGKATSELTKPSDPLAWPLKGTGRNLWSKGLRTRWPHRVALWLTQQVAQLYMLPDLPLRKGADLWWLKSPGWREVSLSQGRIPCFWGSPGSIVALLSEKARIHKSRELHLSFLFPQGKQ